MKKYLLIISSLSLVISLFFAACGGASSTFVNVSMPNFKPQVNPDIKPVSSGARVALQEINIERNNNYTDYFENSVLRIRIDEEIELLKQNLEEQMKNIIALKGYELSNSNPHYKLTSNITIYIDESNAQKSEQWLSGESITSNLGLRFEGHIDFINANKPQSATNIKSNTQLDSNVELVYPIKSTEGVNMFKTTLSSVPTQLNKGLERPAFEIDKSFLSFYKSTLKSLYENMPKATGFEGSETQNEEGYAEFNIDNSFDEENVKAVETSTNESQENIHKHEDDGFVIFD
ncbi:MULTISPECIES: hypothetical protein [unclassified Campylobacter]|uniref:hypothetical protein n=1 Tax=unclassified Campylobacter TaxID=2593542 RepID=UPI0012381A60|nr:MULTISPECIES: hypothetical protein [unclassified Campylobacter]KAA6227327.1 hypothetical protein FMM57_05175 [Campylobacter sp. LR286c]KAA6227798.1 hypothetical protein FMM54_01300 [Campylobacter sp. LR185c]KAA6228206.1 hypothetical protein FMM55_01105 [Campylobacter sp. LR196d]KAA6229206.1 hypothetical protein FMM58_07535 [Campylobacter sp. LR291e]KAA6231011.1 hypothetical protein FMM56_04805 [Campylobacter sp. LR264d]